MSAGYSKKSHKLLYGYERLKVSKSKGFVSLLWTAWEDTNAFSSKIKVNPIQVWDYLNCFFTLFSSKLFSKLFIIFYLVFVDSCHFFLNKNDILIMNFITYHVRLNLLETQDSRCQREELKSFILESVDSSHL